MSKVLVPTRSLVLASDLYLRVEQRAKKERFQSVQAFIHVWLEKALAPHRSDEVARDPLSTLPTSKDKNTWR